jgi:hypothetical protein
MWHASTSHLGVAAVARRHISTLSHRRQITFQHLKITFIPLAHQHPCILTAIPTGRKY